MKIADRKGSFFSASFMAAATLCTLSGCATVPDHPFQTRPPVRTTEAQPEKRSISDIAQTDALRGQGYVDFAPFVRTAQLSPGNRFPEPDLGPEALNGASRRPYNFLRENTDRNSLYYLCTGEPIGRESRNGDTFTGAIALKAQGNNMRIVGEFHYFCPNQGRQLDQRFILQYNTVTKQVTAFLTEIGYTKGKGWIVLKRSNLIDIKDDRDTREEAWLGKLTHEAIGVASRLGRLNKRSALEQQQKTAAVKLPYHVAMARKKCGQFGPAA